MKKEQITLGCTARDTITGYTGAVVAITCWLNGCTRITIQARELKDGKPVESYTADVEQVELVEREPSKAGKKGVGGPSISPTRNADPR
jgi:hypothetical protein